MTFVGLYEETLGGPSEESLLNHISDTPHPEKEKVLHYMKNYGRNGDVTSAVFVDAVNPDRKIYMLAYREDDLYRWNSHVMYYIKHYNLAIPEEFVRHVLRKLSEAE
ncbi:MAG: hypothetical protein LBN26_01295 [Christensenellaceae bacterium]|jgi:hypothetical protein|nr:hypothetical protein [Christensenellaceae bacterium]